MLRISSMCVNSLPEVYFENDTEMNKKYLTLKVNCNDVEFLTKVRELVTRDTQPLKFVTKMEFAEISLSFAFSPLQKVHSLIQDIIVAVYSVGGIYKEKKDVYLTKRAGVDKAGKVLYEVDVESAWKELSNDEFLRTRYLEHSVADITQEQLRTLEDPSQRRALQQASRFRRHASHTTEPSSTPFDIQTSGDKEKNKMAVIEAVTKFSCYEMDEDAIIDRLSFHGVYAIFYVGSKEKEAVPCSLDDFWLQSSGFPVYVGKSCVGASTISKRLKEHRLKLRKAKMADKFIFAYLRTESDSAEACELALVEHFTPIWNKVGNKNGLGFGIAWESHYIRTELDDEERAEMSKKSKADLADLMNKMII